MKFSSIVMAVIAISAVRSSAQDLSKKPTFEMRGEKFGDGFVKRGMCKYKDEKGSGYCMEFFKPELAGVRMEYTVRNYLDKKMYLIGFSFKSEGFEHLADALEGKYGKPDTIYTEALQNRMGAKFLNESRRWYFADGVMEIQRYASDLTKGRLEAVSTEGMKAELARIEAEKKKAASDFDAPTKK